MPAPLPNAAEPDVWWGVGERREKGYALPAERRVNAGHGMIRAQRGLVGADFALFFTGVFFLGWGMRACAAYDPWLALQVVGSGLIVYGLPALVLGFGIGYVAPVKLEVTAALSSALGFSASSRLHEYATTETRE